MYARPESQARLLRVSYALAIMVAFSVTFFRTAWISDDAFITFRVIDNVLHGLGPVWNPGERVQAYTHPLWFGLLTLLGWFTAEQYWTSVWLSFVLLISTLIILLSLRREWSLAPALAIFSLLFSRAFVDFSSSGLENPLTHFLLMVFLATWIKARGVLRTSLLWGLASALFLTRPDTLVIVFPALIWEASRYRHPRDFFVGTAGLLPSVAWILFSFFYYGSPLPNTALAKVGTGTGAGNQFVQTLHYFQWAADEDLASLLLIAAGIVVGSLKATSRPISAGLVAWICYLFYVGADFMGGRFLSAPVLLSCGLMVVVSTRTSGAMLAIIIAFCSPSLKATVFSPFTYHKQSIASSGIADERGFYYPYTGVAPVLASETWHLHPWLHLGYALRSQPGLYTRCAIGMAGYAGGPEIHWLDPLGLADPLLSRLPARNGARIGHFERALPEGYLTSLLSGENQIKSPKIRALYDDIKLVTRSPLSSKGRAAAIFRLNSGYHADAASDYDREAIGLPGVPVQTSSPFSCFGLPYGADGTWRILGNPLRAQQVELLPVPVEKAGW